MSDVERSGRVRDEPGDGWIELRIDGEPARVRVGTTVALRLSPRHTIRLAGSVGAINRIGGDFTSVGLSYAYNWVRTPR